MADPTPVFPALQMNTHMPFFDGKYLLFCGSEHVAQQEFPNRGDIFRRMLKDQGLREHFASLPKASRVSYRDWKLYYCLWASRQPTRLNTGLPQDYIECSPSMYQDAGQVYVSFISGTLSERGPDYYLYTMSGPSIDRLSTAVRAVPAPTFFGFINKKYICVSHQQGISLTDRDTKKQTILTCSLQRILRVSYRAETPDILLITGVGDDQAPKTLHYNPTNKVVDDIRSSVPVYKSSIVGDQLVVAVRSGTAVEPYQLMSSSYSLGESKEKLRII